MDIAVGEDLCYAYRQEKDIPNWMRHRKVINYNAWGYRNA